MATLLERKIFLPIWSKIAASGSTIMSVCLIRFTFLFSFRYLDRHISSHVASLKVCVLGHKCIGWSVGGIKLRLWGSSSLCALGWQYVEKGIILVFKGQVISVCVMLMQSAKGIIGFFFFCTKIHGLPHKWRKQLNTLLVVVGFICF